MKKILAAFGLILSLAACAADQAPPPAHADRSAPPKIMLDVQTINLADRSGLQPVSSPYNGNHFSPTISDAIKQWAGDRLQASGQSGQAIIVIKDASLIEQPLPVTQGIDGWFTRQQGTKYIARANVSIEANGREGFAMADAVATRTVTLPENPTAIEKQDIYYTLLNGLMKDLGQNLETGIQTHMSSFITASAGYGSSVVSDADILSPVVIQSPAGSQSPMPAIAAATIPLPPQIPVTQPIMTISQSNQPAAAQSGYGENAYISPAPTAVSQAALPAMQQAPQPPQAPVLGSAVVPTIPDLGSSPSSFQMQASDMPMPVAPQPPLPQPGMGYPAYASNAMPQAAAAPAAPAFYAPPVVASDAPRMAPVTVQLSGPQPFSAQ